MLRWILILPILTLMAVRVFAVDTNFTFRVPGDYESVAKERHFQLSNFSSPSALFITPPAFLDSSSRFGESLDAFRHRDHRFVIVGAPLHRNGSGAVILCSFKTSASIEGHFSCESKALPLVQPSGAGPDDARGMLLGSSVAAITSEDNEGFSLYCGHLYRQASPPDDRGQVQSDYKGLCNFLPLGSREKGPITLTPCVAGSCLAGFSSGLALSREGGEDLVLAIGAPNLEPGRGQVQVSRVPLGTPRKPDRFHFSHVQDSRSRAFYRGYATSLGHEGREDRVAVSTPSDFEVGRVELFGDLLKGGTHRLQHLQGFESPVGEGFGLALTSLHLTGGPNQRNDLAVGEPFHSASGAADVGRVVLFCRRGAQKTYIVGPEANGRFGTAVSAIPDLNGDGIDELAIGCPYCDEGHGAVFFFLGDPSCSFTAPAQVILGRRMDPPLRQLGSSLSTGTDLDGNGATDLLMGAPASGRALLARARGVLLVTSSVAGRCVVMTDSRRIRICRVTFNFDLRLAAEKSPPLDPKRLRLRCHLALDSLKENLKRLSYDRKFAVSFDRELQRLSTSNSYTASVTLETKRFAAVKTALFFDKTTPLNITARLELVEKGPGSFPMPRLKPLPSSWSKSVDLGNLACGMKPCEADFSVEIATDRYPDNVIRFGDPNVTLIVHVRNAGPELDEIDSNLRLTFANGLTPLRIATNPLVPQPQCASDGENVEVCQLGRSFASGSSLRLQVDMDALALTHRDNWDRLARAGPPRLTAEVIPASHDPSPDNNTNQYEMKVLYEPKLLLIPAGATRQTIIDVRNASASIRARERVHQDRIGPQIRQLFHLANQGIADVFDVKFNFSVPLTSMLGERLLYLVNDIRAGDKSQPAGPRIESESGRSHGNCEVPRELLNPLNLTIVGGVESRRYRRSVPEAAESDAAEGSGQDRLECGTMSRYFGEPRCAVVKCHLDRLLRKDSVRIIFEGWLWSESILKRHVSDVEVVTSLEGIIATVPPTAMVQEGSLQIARVNQSTHIVFPNVKIPSKDQLPIWVIVLSVIAGIILLGLIVLCLRQVGFFKRKRRSTYATHVRRFQKYGGSSDLELEDEEEEVLGSTALLPCPDGAPKVTDRQPACGSMDTGISEAPNSSTSSPSQALKRRDGGYESPGKLSDGSL